MPLRGSKVRPEGDIKENLDELKEAKKDIRVTELELEHTKSIVHDVEEIVATPTTGDLLLVIKTLEKKIDLLQHHLDEQKARKSKANEELVHIGKQLACGGIAGAAARTTVAPIDRVKILMQTQHVTLNENKYTGILQTWKKIITEEGVAKLWRGNVMNVVRVIPYSATQFASYDFYKHKILSFSGNHKKPTTVERLAAGAMAGMTATSLTHPLDVIRLRLNVQPELKGSLHAFQEVWAERGVISLFKGYTPTLLSLAPFIAINFAAFDTLKSMVYGDKPKTESNILGTLSLGAVAGVFAQTCCYPLDTVRRRMQLKGTVYKHTGDAFYQIFKKEGPLGFYKGMVPNAVKVVPNNAIRFLVFDSLKDYFGVQRGEGGGGGG